MSIYTQYCETGPFAVDLMTTAQNYCAVSFIRKYVDSLQGPIKLC